MRSQLNEDGVPRMLRVLPKVYLSREESKKIHSRTFRKLRIKKFKRNLAKAIGFFTKNLVEITLAVIIIILLFQLK